MERGKERFDKAALGVFSLAFVSALCISTAITGIEPAAHDCCHMLCSTIDSMDFSYSESAGIMKALLCGDRSGISASLKQTFRASGSSHILALSGMHLGLIYAIICTALKLLGNSPLAKKIRSLTAVSIASFYTLATGAGPSVTRALLFILIREAARLAGRECSLKKCLVYALVLQLMMTPECISTPGFQLSYLATAGLCFLFPLMERIYPGNGRKGILDPLKRLWNLTCVSISCQAFTCGAVWIYFHSLPQHFLMSNLLAMPIASLAMMLSAAAIPLQAAGICPQLLTEGISMLCRGLVFVLETVEGM